MSKQIKNEITYKVFTYKSYIYPFNCVKELLIVNRIIHDRLKYLKTFNCAQRKSFGLSKNVMNKMCLQIIDI